MTTATNRVFAAYLNDEASLTGDWLRLSIMLVLLVLARMAQPQPVPTATIPAPVLDQQYLLPVGLAPSQRSQPAPYPTRYHT